MANRLQSLLYTVLGIITFLVLAAQAVPALGCTECHGPLASFTTPGLTDIVPGGPGRDELCLSCHLHPDESTPDFDPAGPGISADYQKIAATCAQLVPLFERAVGIQVSFSTGHSCYFDTSDNKPAFVDNGLLHPGQDAPVFANLPAGEVATCPNEDAHSLTAGQIPVAIGDETIVFTVKNNQIIKIMGDGPVAEQKRQEFREETALRNIAEVAIGCNDRAVVTGNVLEDEKAGFHWAYGRSDFLGGRIGVQDFSSPDKVSHIDTVYAKGNPIVCQRFDFIFADGSRKTAITDGLLGL